MRRFSTPVAAARFRDLPGDGAVQLLLTTRSRTDSMTLFSTRSQPAAEPVTLAEAKAHLRLRHDSEDELFAGLIRAAREEVEARPALR